MKYLVFLLKVLFVQLAFCQVFRVLFLTLSPVKLDFTLVLGSLISGFQFDLGISLIVLVLLSLFQWLISSVIPLLYHNLFLGFFFILITFQAMAAVGDIILYKYWDCIFSVRAYPYLKNISELFKNVSTFNFVFVVFYLGFITILFFYVSNKMKLFAVFSIKWFQRGLVIICLILLAFLAIRGGLREIPRNQSDGFYCSNRTYNISSINSTWNFFNVLVENQKFLEKNPYKKLSDTIMLIRVNEMQRDGVIKDVQIFSFSTQPNIVLITMEGVSAEVFKIHNGQIAHMPFLESLLDSSYYFMRAFSVGSRTEQGLAAMLSGSLATPYNNITDNISTLSDIPSILTTMNKRKYHTQFVFGGNVEFANMRAYLNQMGYDTVLDIVSFDKKRDLQSLGVPDEYLVDALIDQYEKLKLPFFLHTLTLSTHEPFDIPGLKTYSSEKKMYLQSVTYLDNQLKKLFSRLATNKKFDNTVFIITSDHGHKMPNNYDIASKERYHIPMILYSKKLNSVYRGYQDTSLFAQQNFPATLSYLLGWKEKNYLKFSRNHFTSMNRYTMSAFVNGYLFQTDTSSISYDYVWRPYDTANKELVRQHSYPQALLQYLADQIRGVRPIKEK
jgi:phosphoglycerol transferase MdoB-like AlkP superfamily enzyme